MNVLLSAAVAASLIAGAPSSASAAPANPLQGEHGFIYTSGHRELSRPTTRERSRAMGAALARFDRASRKPWTADLDARTGAVARMWGGYVEAPGSVRSAAIAERAARDVLARHLDLLGGGAEVSDFVLVANDLTDNLRTVAFVQRHEGMPVEGGQLSFRFKNDRLFMIASNVVPVVDAERPAKLVAERQAHQRAAEHLARALDVEVEVDGLRGPVVLSLAGDPAADEPAWTRAAVIVTARSTRPTGRWDVYLDARTGEVLARRQTLMFAGGTLLMNTPTRRPGDTREDFPAKHATVEVDGQMVDTDDSGRVTWSTDQAARVRLWPEGGEVRVINASGFTASVSVSLMDGGSYTWNESRSELVDAQLTTYIAALRAKEHGRLVAPEMAWLDFAQLQATVNIDDVCNAFSDGETINFFRSGQGCENTGRLPDVVYHEFGHAFHYHAIIQGAGRFDTALSEGASDFYAASITGDPATAVGFFFDDEPLRHIDPADDEAKWPDGISNDPHETGLIFAGAMWDLRKALIAEIGREPALDLVNRILLGVLARAVDIPSSFNEALAVADDDGDLSNGTPHFCLLYEAFARHGLAATGINAPGTFGLDIFVAQPEGVTCPGAQVASAQILWEVRGEPEVNGVLDMSLVGTEWTTTLPADRQNVVIRYRMEMTLGDGTVVSFPKNVADPMYEAYVGSTVPLYCTDFEGDPFAEGWAHASLAAEAAEGADDWQVGAPTAVFGSGDPNVAHSGAQVIGNDLGGEDSDGRYGANVSIALTSPVIETMGFQAVRLQYWRWLGVEDSQSDQARIVGNGEVLWQNASSGERFAPLNHLDGEWRFHDVDLSGVVVDGAVQVTYDLTTNRRRRLGGWTIDDFCVLGVAICGNGAVEASEVCDDGNTESGDGCEVDCTITQPVCGNGRVEAGEACDDGNTRSGDGCESSCAPTPPASCGNGIVEGDEQCDDGVLDGQTCSPGCQTPTTLVTVEEGGCGCAATSTSRGAQGSLLCAAVLLVAAVLGRRRQGRP